MNLTRELNTSDLIPNSSQDKVSFDDGISNLSDVIILNMPQDSNSFDLISNSSRDKAIVDDIIQNLSHPSVMSQDLDSVEDHPHSMSIPIITTNPPSGTIYSDSLSTSEGAILPTHRINPPPCHLKFLPPSMDISLGYKWLVSWGLDSYSMC